MLQFLNLSVLGINGQFTFFEGQITKFHIFNLLILWANFPLRIFLTDMLTHIKQRCFASSFMDYQKKKPEKLKYLAGQNS